MHVAGPNCRDMGKARKTEPFQSFHDDEAGITRNADCYRFSRLTNYACPASEAILGLDPLVSAPVRWRHNRR